MNPIQVVSPILYEPYRVHFHVWSYNSNTGVWDSDLARYNWEILLNVIDPDTSDTLYEANPLMFDEIAPTTGVT